MASKLRQEFSKFNLKDDTPCPARKAFRTDPLVLGKVVLRPDTTLDKTKVCQFLELCGSFTAGVDGEYCKNNNLHLKTRQIFYCIKPHAVVTNCPLELL